MIVKNIEKKEDNTVSFQVSCDAAEFEKAINSAYLKAKKNIYIPGFRKGKAPRAIIEGMYGSEVFYQDAMDELAPEAFDQGVKEGELKVVGAPAITDVNVTEEKGVEYTFSAEVYPAITLGQYKGLEAERPVREITEQDIDDELETARKRNARKVSADDREAKMGDIANIDFDGYLNGERFDGGKSEGYDLTLGSNSFVPGFEDQIVGHKAGEEFDVNVKFPDDYVEDLAGKDATFKVKLDNVKEKQLPELDDDFVLDVSEYDTVDELKQHTKEDLEKSKTEAADAEVDTQIFEKLAGIVKSEIPQAMFEHQIDDSVSEFGYQIQSQGLDLKTYLGYTGMTEEDLRNSFRSRAESQVKCRLALEKIAELENVEVTEEDLDAQYKDLAEQYGMEEDSVRKILSEDDISKDVKTKKALEIVKDAAEITEVTEEQLQAERAAEAAAAEAEQVEEEEKAEAAEAETESAETESAETETAEAAEENGDAE